MLLFLDTASIEEVREVNSWGILDGVNLDPSRLAQSGQPLEQVARAILEVADAPVFIEATKSECADIIVQARQFVDWDNNVVVKMPLTREGLKAARLLSVEGIKTTLTPCYSLAQALLASKAGATYVGPLGEGVGDIRREGMDLIREVRGIFAKYDLLTHVLAENLSDTKSVGAAALAGADAATINYSLFGQLVDYAPDSET